MTYAGATTSYSYDRDRLLTSAGAFNITRVLDTTLRQSLTDGSYTQQTTYNGYGEVAEQNDSLYGYNITRNASGQIIQKTETLNKIPRTYLYSYDDRERLIEVKNSAQTIREDAQDETIDKWEIYDNDPTGASISNIYDIDKQSYVIQTEGSEIENGYVLGKWSGSKMWKSTDTTVSWSMKFNENFHFTFVAETTKGRRYIYYSPKDIDAGIRPNGQSIHHGLGVEAKDGTWHTYTRDLQADLQDYEPDNSIIYVNGCMVRGSGRIDDIKTIAEDGIETIKDNAEQKNLYITYEHNALNQRVAKLINGEVVEKYLWADLTTLLAVYDAEDTLIQRFEYAGGRMPVAMTDGNGTRYYLHYDQVGSLRAVSDTNGTMVKEVLYDTFGNVLLDSNPNFKVPFGWVCRWSL